MNIDPDLCNAALLKASRIELKKRANRIEALECALHEAKMRNNLLSACCLILVLSVMV